MARTFPVGYSGDRMTEQQIRQWDNFQRLDPETARRTLAMMNAAANAGQDLGIGSSWRSAARADELYQQYRSGQRSAPAAPANRTYHTEKQTGYCYATDMIGALPWMNRNCSTFGLRHFANVNKEPWHVQALELPTACSSTFKGTKFPAWPLPGDTPEQGEDELSWHDPIPNLITGKDDEAWSLLMGAHEAAYKAMQQTADIPAIVDKEVNEAVRFLIEDADGQAKLGAIVGQQLAAFKADILAAIKAELGKA